MGDVIGWVIGLSGVAVSGVGVWLTIRYGDATIVHLEKMMGKDRKP